MQQRKFRLLAAILVIANGLAASASMSAEVPIVSHAIDARLNPEAGTITATDVLQMPKGISSRVELLLHRGLDPEVVAGDAEIERAGSDGHLAVYRLRHGGSGAVTLSYSGPIRHALEAVREGMGRARQQSIGTIGDSGAFLSGYTGWYPRITGTLETLSLSVELPRGWLAVSQGQGPIVRETPDGVEVRWSEPQPQDELYLVAGAFTLYRQATPVGEAQAYLRRPDADLAARYLDATGLYLSRYSDLIGPYPYDKFALVENFWETGYGMPSFTLLGPRVLRLPFILHSSYPHEILHNWWGNGVYVDYSAGNWSEGLTAYLADHLNQELAGRGSDYRRSQLKAYADYVRDDDGIALTEFRGRHGSASQAIGYGKALMLFHMLRVKVGDERFTRAIQRFFNDNRFQAAGYADIANAFAAESAEPIRAFIQTWSTSTGAPRLAVDRVTLSRGANGDWALRGRIRQVQPGSAFPLPVPIVIHDEQGAAREIIVDMTDRSASFEAELPVKPIRIAVDPRFDTFRALAAGEAPAALSALFGAERGVIVLPADAGPAFAEGYRSLAESWLQGLSGWRIVLDTELDALPSGRAVWLLGWENRWIGALSQADRESQRFSIEPEGHALTLLDQHYEGLSTALATTVDEQPLGWVAADTPAALPGLARKLPRYGKYGHLLFGGEAPDNRVKGEWPPGESELVVWLTEERPTLALRARSPLIAP